MPNIAKTITKEILSCFMIVGSATEPSWKQAGQRLAMDSLMLASGLMVMGFNLFNISMHDRAEVKVGKQAATMILGMGLGMLLYKLAGLALQPCTRNTKPGTTTESNPDDSGHAFHTLPGAPV